jgi:sporulation protein YlmC with PRC-barrel domain
MKRCMLITALGIVAIFIGTAPGSVFAQKETGSKQPAQGEELSTYEPAKGERINAFMVEKIVGSKVRTMKGEDVGTIKDIVVDIDAGRILYAVMDMGGFLGIGGKLLPIPWRSLAPLPSEGIFFLNISEDKLKDAPAYNKDSLPDMGDLHWGTKLAAFYAASREGQTYDYGLDYGPGLLYPNIAQRDPFAETFDPTSMKTVSGEVIKVERVVPEKGDFSEMQLELIVFADTKEPIPVFLGPIWYIIGPDRRIPFKSGDRITATGSWITSRTEPFLIATAVTKGDRTLNLRRENGSPVWNAWEKIGEQER